MIEFFQAKDWERAEIAVHEGPLGCTAGQIQGQRLEQQDCYGWAVESGQFGLGEQMLLMLADGMGGHACGGLASRAAIEAFGKSFCFSGFAVAERFEASLYKANRAVAQAARSRTLQDIGTTLVAAQISPASGLCWISVGDSPMWLFRAGRLERLNEDHSLKPILAQMAKVGDLTFEEAAKDSRQHQLRSAVMGGDIPLRDLREEPVSLVNGTILIIASDGLLTLNEAEIATIVQTNRMCPQAVANALLMAVQEKDNPLQDNATVIIYSPSRL